MSDPTDDDVDSAIASLAPPSSSKGRSSGDTDVDDAMASLGERTSQARPHAAAKTSATPVSVPHAPSRYQKAVQPVVAPEKELSWAEAGQGALKNAIPSTEDMIHGMADAIIGHPAETVKNLGQLGLGAISQGAGALGIHGDPKAKAKTEALVSALEDHYKQTYGSAKGFKKAVSQDPASIAADAATFLDGIGAIGKMGKVGSLTSKVGEIASKASSAVDPLQNAVRVAKLPVSIVKKSVPIAQSFFSGATPSVLKTAAEAGASTNPSLRATFRAHLTGSAPPSEIPDAINDAVNAIAKKRGEQYVDNMKQVSGGNLPSMDWQPVKNALAKNVEASHFVDHATGTSISVHEGALEALDKISGKIDAFSSQPAGSRAHTLEGFDKLKQAVGDIRNGYRNDPVAYQKATDMYNQVLGAIKNQNGPLGEEYANAMSQYGAASENLSDLKRSFGVGNKNSHDEATLQKVLNSKPGSAKETLLSQLAQHDPRIPYMIAGHALSPMLPGGLRTALGSATAAMSGSINPLLPVAQLAASSPRLAASLNLNAGRLAGAANKVLGPLTDPNVMRSGYYASRNQDNASQQPIENTTEPVDATDQDRQALNKVVQLEAGGEDRASQEAVARTFINRAKERGISIYDAVHEKNASEPITQGKDVDLDSPGSKQTAEIIGDVLSGKSSSPVPDAVNFFNDELQQKMHAKDPKRYKYPPDFAKNPDGSLRTDGRKVGQMIYYPSRELADNRPSHASGGKVVDRKVERLVNRLMKLADKAKTETDKSTKPLLHSSDEAIVHALHIAQKAI